MTMNALVFAGAGASKAVNKDRFPTTVEFFQQLPEDIRQHRLFQHVHNFLSRSDGARTIDIEEVLWELETLANFARDAASGEGIVGYSLSGEKLANIVLGPGHTFSHLHATLASTRARAEELIGEINATVYDFYKHEPSEEELSDNWLYLLSSMRSAGWKTDIFTTNYDIAIEAAISMDGTLPYDKYVGLTGRIRKRLNLDRWQKPRASDHLFTKLHGSIDWQFGGDDIYVGAPVYTGDHKKQAIIYPGFKGQSESRFFGPLHNYLGERLEAAEVAVFIGFAFRDDYINQMIAERMNPGCRVIVINPDKKVAFPIGRHRPLYVRRGFDRSSVDEAIVSVS